MLMCALRPAGNKHPGELTRAVALRQMWAWHVWVMAGGLGSNSLVSKGGSS